VIPHPTQVLDIDLQLYPPSVKGPPPPVAAPTRALQPPPRGASRSATPAPGAGGARARPGGAAPARDASPQPRGPPDAGAPQPAGRGWLLRRRGGGGSGPGGGVPERGPVESHLLEDEPLRRHPLLAQLHRRTPLPAVGQVQAAVWWAPARPRHGLDDVVERCRWVCVCRAQWG
jgi:hypothetical protein